MKPVIGIMPLYDNEKNSIWMLPNYMRAVKTAGGLPVILPLEADEEDLLRLAGLCDGFLLTGGDDLDPALYGQKKLAVCGEVIPLRDKMDLAIANLALENKKPLMGICKGIQVVNVAMGGTLYQDIPSQCEEEDDRHSQKQPRGEPSHMVQVEKESPLYSLLGEETLFVNSFHHQGIDRLAGGLLPMAKTKNGLIEAAYAPGQPYVRVYQWHPEWMYETDDRQLALFEDFIKASRE